MEKLPKIFKIITLLSKGVTIMVATLSVISMVITGFYPGIIMLLFVTLLPTFSHFYAKKISSKSTVFQRNYYIAFTILNSLSILLVIYMSFVIVIDRVIPGIKFIIN